jgi:bifunctional DNA-binding transcriptional regulator/antitoxin component of YhaV-PrlF toxin-antitoxin module
MTKMIVKEDENGELYIDLPDELMEEMGWDIDTELVWTVADDGTIGLRKRIDDPSNEA